MEYYNVIAPAVGWVFEKLAMGIVASRESPDVAALRQAHEKAMELKEKAMYEKLSAVSIKYEEQLKALEDMKIADVKAQNAANKLKAEFEQAQENIRNEMESERQRYESRITALAESMQQADKRALELQEQLEKPIENRQAKIDFVNNLKLEIRQIEAVLLAGPKGMGKSTFMWLLNRGPKPKQSFTDGTQQIVQLKGFVDSIGLRGWAPEELSKLLVLLIYNGIPKDVIIFGNDRIDLPVTSLGLLGITNPMIVIMSSDFWKNCEPLKGEKKRIKLIPSKTTGVRKVDPVGDLDLVYNLRVYHDIKDFGMGLPITHHDNIEAKVKERSQKGVCPFKCLMAMLGNVFTVGMESMESQPTIETLFRFIYVYEKKYGKRALDFMNNATLQDFAGME